MPDTATAAAVDTHDVAHLGSIGPSAAAFHLRAHDFSGGEAYRVAVLLERFANGDFPDLADADVRRLVFACWRRDHGQLHDGHDGELSAVPATYPRATPSGAVAERMAA